MNRFHRFAGLCLAFSIAAVAIAQDKTEPNPVPRGFRMYIVADGRFDDEAKKKDAKKNPKDVDPRIRVGKLHDPVTEIGLNTVVAAFVRGVPKDEEDPGVKVLKFQQTIAKKYRTQRLGAFLAFLALSKDFAEDDNRYALMADIKKIADAAVVPLVAVGLAEGTLADGAAPPQNTAWGIGTDDAITIVVYHRFNIVKRWAFKADAPPSDADLQAVAEEVDKIIGRKVE